MAINASCFSECSWLGRVVTDREVRMSDRPIDVIASAIRSAIIHYPKEDDPEPKRPHWIKPEEYTHLALGILLELQARGFDITEKVA